MEKEAHYGAFLAVMKSVTQFLQALGILEFNLEFEVQRVNSEDVSWSHTPRLV